MLGVGPKAGRRRFIDHVHRHRLIAGVFDIEVQSGGDQDRHISIQVHGLVACTRGPPAGLNKVNLLLPFEPLRFRRRMRCQCCVRVRVDEAKDRTLLCRVHGIATREDVPLLDRAVDYPSRRGVPVAKIEINAVSRGLRKRQRREESAKPEGGEKHLRLFHAAEPHFEFQTISKS